MTIFIYGDDSYRSWHKLQEIREKFNAKVDPTGSSVVVMEGDSFDVNEFREHVMSPALFAKERMVIIKNLLQQTFVKKIQEQILEIMEKTDDNVLIFWEQIENIEAIKRIKNLDLYKELSKAKYVQVFNKMKDAELERWVLGRVKELGGQIAKPIARSLIALVGNDLWHLDNELIKLTLYRDGQEITMEDVDLLVKARIDNDIWQFTDSLARNNKKAALKLLNEQLISGSEASELFAKMIWQFRVLILVKEVMAAKTLTSSEVAKELGLHPYVVQKSLPVIKNFTIDKLYYIYSRLAQVDIQIKTGEASPELLLDHLIINI